MAGTERCSDCQTPQNPSASLPILPKFSRSHTALPGLVLLAFRMGGEGRVIRLGVWQLCRGVNRTKTALSSHQPEAIFNPLTSPPPGKQPPPGKPTSHPTCPSPHPRAGSRLWNWGVGGTGRLGGGDSRLVHRGKGEEPRC